MQAKNAKYLFPKIFLFLYASKETFPFNFSSLISKNDLAKYNPRAVL